MPMRFVAILFGSLIFVFAIHGCIANWGLHQPITTYDNAFFKPQEKMTAVAWDSTFTLHPKFVIWMEAYQGKNGVLLVRPSSGPKADKEARPEKRPQTSTENYPELSTLLSSFLQKNPERRFIIYANHNAENIDQQLAHMMDNSSGKTISLEGKVLIYSEVDNVITSTKELQPTWLYGSSSGDRLRMNVFESLYLLPAAPFKKDVFVSPLFWHRRKSDQQVVSAAIIQEMRRRQKKVILGPLESKSEVDLAQSLGADGLILSDAALVETSDKPEKVDK